MTPADIDSGKMKRNAEKAVSLLKELANEHRLMVLCVLSEGELSVSALNQRIGLSQSALSQHLARLRQQGLVNTRREGQTVYYSLVESPAVDVIQLMHDHFCATRPH